MGWVNKVVPLADIEQETLALCHEILQKSPTALRFIKAAMNADTDGPASLQQIAGDSTMLFYESPEAKEGRDAYLQKRQPDFNKFPKFP